MQSASPSARLGLGRVVLGTRESLGGGQVWSALLVILLSITVAGSTATAAWVPGIDIITIVAFGATVFMGLLALLPIPWPAALGLGTVAGPPVAVVAAWFTLQTRNPIDPTTGHALTLGRMAGIWSAKIADGSASGDPSFYLLLICLLMWITGGWLGWCVLRWRRPLLGFVPGAAAFATNLLNFPDNQKGYTLAILVLTLALLLWVNYTRSVTNATRAHVKLTGDARWDFWESGLVAMAGLIIVALMLPPMSTADRTLDVESGAFASWAQFQQQINHPGLFSMGRGGTGTTGFSTDVKLQGPLLRTRDVVFTYTVAGWQGPRYFRGVDETSTLYGEWRYPAQNGLHQVIPKNQVPTYAEDYSKLAVATVDVKMLRPPIGNSDILFYPGRLYRVDRSTMALQVPSQPLNRSGELVSIDRLNTTQPSTSAGTYKVTAEYSIAGADELKGAGTVYPDWVRPFMSLPQDGRYRNPAVEQKIHDLAVSIVTSAGAITPYDQATAIETYLRSDKFTYTLDARVPAGMDAMDWFLFQSHKGYCEFFATAMGDMLRSLGIPARLVNGFGPGVFDSQSQSYVVRGQDAHTWVEVYFPAYGWIPFEPTKDGTYTPISRGQTGLTTCLHDSGCDDPGTAGSTGSVAPVPGVRPGSTDSASAGSQAGRFPVSFSDPGTLTKVLGLIIALVLLVFAGVTRYLRPRSVMGVWKRTLTLARLAGAERPPGETPMELGRRLQREFPEAADSAGSLASGFAVAAYAPPELASSVRGSVFEAWSALRPILLRRMLARLRPY